MSGEVWTPVKLVQWAAGYLKNQGIPGARLDAELLTAHVLGTDRLGVYLQFERPLSDPELSALRDLIKRRAGRVPLSYLVGWREFFGLRFTVTPDVLIPRPESEQLVSEVLRFMEGLPEERRTVLDLGTGSGCIAVALVRNMPCRVWAVDASGGALAVAEKNAQDLQAADRVVFRKGSWYEALTREDPQRFSVIVSNPPYVFPEEREHLAPEVLKEPSAALFAGPTGLEAYEAILRDLPDRLEKEGRAFLELNAKYADKIEALFNHPDRQREVHRDLQGLPRVMVLKQN